MVHALVHSGQTLPSDAFSSDAWWTLGLQQPQSSLAVLKVLSRFHFIVCTRLLVFELKPLFFCRFCSAHILLDFLQGSFASICAVSRCKRVCLGYLSASGSEVQLFGPNFPNWEENGRNLTRRILKAFCFIPAIIVLILDCLQPRWGTLWDKESA